MRKKRKKEREKERKKERKKDRKKERKKEPIMLCLSKVKEKKNNVADSIESKL